MKQYRIAKTTLKDDQVPRARSRLTQVFRYLQELHRLRTPPAVRLQDREWALRLDTLPATDHVQLGFQFEAAGGAAGEAGWAGADYVLRVSRPGEVECPEPSVVLKNWLKPGYDDARVDPQTLLKKTVKVRGGARQTFEDADERVEAFEKWVEERAEWAQSALQAADAFRLFSDFFELHSRFERESEKYQLYLADGILELEHEGQKVQHPLLLQRVELRFDPTVPEFRVVDSADTPEIFTPLLRHIGLDGHVIQHLVDAVAEGHFHPLAGEPTSAFLRDIAQRCWTDGQFCEDPVRAGPATGPRISRAPHLILGNRSYGLDENIQRYLRSIDRAAELPASLLRIVGIEAERPEADGPADLLLTKPANPEQVEVIRRLEETGAVLVQGPPGTGKSHTIANLIGHLLAQNKSILVTSHASKALRVVREKLPPALQPLCVSVLQSDDESTRQLEESITGILNMLASTSIKKLEKEIEKLKQQRTELASTRDGLRAELLAAVQGEYRELELLGDTLTAADAALRLAEWQGQHDWIPAPVEVGTELPLSAAELTQLYQALAELPAEMEEMARGELPDIAVFPSPKDFATLLDEMAALEKARVDARSDLWTGELPEGIELPLLLEQMQKAAAALRVETDWERACLRAGSAGGADRATWQGLIDQIEEAAAEIAELQPLVAEHAPAVPKDAKLDALAADFRKVAEHLDAGGTPEDLALAEVLPRLVGCRVGSGDPAASAHFWALLSEVEIRARRHRLGAEWDRLMGSAGGPGWSTLRKDAPEQAAMEYLPAIREALAWYGDHWGPVAQALQAAGFDWQRLLQKTAGGPKGAVEPKALLALVDTHAPQAFQQRQRQLRLLALQADRQRSMAALDSVPRKGHLGSLVTRFRTGLKKSDYDAYADAWQELSRLHEAQGQLATVDELMGRLEAAAPGWAAALRERKVGAGTGKLPGDPKAAWQYRQWATLLANQSGIDLGKLQDKLDAATDTLFEKTASYVEKSSWLAQLRRTGLEQQQALGGWLQLQKKIGKGTGKHVPLLKEEAKRALSRCRSAVPVWIMPLSRVVESFDLATTRFDTVILDEASQCDVMGLLAFALAREVVVVGDHEQVSPYAVGISADQVRALIDELLPDVPNRQLYDGKTSVYDLAQQSFGGTIRLLEHFRCVPDIIRFSNDLCYGGAIRPLREATSARVTPALVAHRVKSGVDKNGINQNEAQEIAALVAAMCRLEEYEGCTFGVISMIGTDQALYIDSILRGRLSITEYRRRQILCGNASQFQGDERDIILLSMVNSPGQHPLAMRQRDDARKVFNVAASRARDQLWVVHSLNPGRDLKSGDLRLQLINHAESGASRPLATEPESIPKRLPEASKDLCRRLERAGYRLWHDFTVGDGEIELVVEGAGGRRVAVDCVGDRVLSADEVEERLERQLELRRLGWQFLRVRAADYVCAADTVFKDLCERLRGAAVVPLQQEAKGGRKKAAKEEAPAEPLHEKVLQRAAMIRSRWSVPAASETLAAARPETAEPVATGSLSSSKDDDGGKDEE